MTPFAPLPTGIDVNGAKIPIQTDFRASVAFETAMEAAGEDSEKIVDAMLSCYFAEDAASTVTACLSAGHADALVSAVLCFYRGGRPETKATAPTKKERPLYAFSHDAERIFAAFRQHYGIDLYTVTHLHWWQFRAMFAALPEDCEIVRIMHIRGAKPEKGMSAKERASLRKAQAAYALPDTRTEAEKEADFTAGFSAMF